MHKDITHNVMIVETCGMKLFSVKVLKSEVNGRRGIMKKNDKMSIIYDLMLGMGVINN